MNLRGIPAGALVLMAVDVGSVEVQTLDVEHYRGRFSVKSGILVDAPVERVFEVLSDYERLTVLHPSIRKAEVVERPAASVTVVDTWIRGCAAFICRTLKRRERIETDGKGEIVARTGDETNEAESVSETRWTLKPEGAGTLVGYEASVTPGFWVPPFIGAGLVKRELKSTLVETLEKVETLAKAEQ